MNNLKELLQELGISKVRLAKYLGVSRQMVYNYLELDSLNKWPKEKKILLFKLLDIDDGDDETIANIHISTDYLMNIESKLIQRLGVSGGVAAARALLAPDHQGDLGMAAEYVPGLGYLVEDLIRCHKGEVPVHQLCDGAHPTGGGAQGGADDGGLRDGGVADPVRAEFLVEAPGAAVHNGTEQIIVIQ